MLTACSIDRGDPLTARLGQCAQDQTTAECTSMSQTVLVQKVSGDINQNYNY